MPIFTNIFLGMALTIIIFNLFYMLSKKRSLHVSHIYLTAVIGGVLAVLPNLLSLLGINLSGYACNIFFFNCYLRELDEQTLSTISKMLNNIIGGMSIGLMFFELAYFYNKKVRDAPDLKYFYIFSLLGAIISLFPTILRLTTKYEMPELVCNLFFFNCLIQKLDPVGTEAFSFIFFSLFFITIIIVSLLIKKEKKSYMLPTIE
ncbi:MAG: hypothetical protein N3E38_00130 [Candidatus Aenigmarchaeota archaeon]|nr:hypothetical protein [Candidatus Aenigmarchaeota archaeon]MCX8179137.1 hypothetical protein [Candidatus Aenigmarchaeota archaeon]